MVKDKVWKNKYHMQQYLSNQEDVNRDKKSHTPYLFIKNIAGGQC